MKTRPSIISVITDSNENKIAKSILTFAGKSDMTTEYYTMSDSLYEKYLTEAYGILAAKKIMSK